MIRRLRVTVDGNAYDVTVELADEAPGQALASATAPPAPPAVSVNPPPIDSATPAAPARAPAHSAGPVGPGAVPSPLAGRVTAIVVTARQEVKEGDHLLTLEAMKMNTFVFAPTSGKVAEIKTAVGDAVEENQVLMTIA